MVEYVLARERVGCEVPVCAPLIVYSPEPLGDTEPQTDTKEVGVNNSTGVEVAPSPMEGVPLLLPTRGVKVLHKDTVGAPPEGEGSREGEEAEEGEIVPTPVSVAPWQGEGGMVPEPPPVLLPVGEEEVHSVSVLLAEGEMEGTSEGVG